MNFIGISGLAGSGKDLFLKLFSEDMKKIGLSCRRYALADSLKAEINPLLVSLYNIDILTCSRKDKEIVRPMLVSHGKIKRIQTNGRHWIEKLDKEIDKGPRSDFVCVTDIRYDEYIKDELNWVKKERNGILLHISKYYKKGKEKIFLEPPNKEEAENDPKIQKKADYKICWPHGEEEFDKALSTEVFNFTKWFFLNGRRDAPLEED